MDLLDANILIGAFRTDDPDNAVLRAYLEDSLSSGGLVTFPPLVETAFYRITTHPKIFKTPSSFAEASKFMQAILTSGAFRESRWTASTRERWQHWCRSLALSGDNINDACLAAIATDQGCRLVSRDRGFARFRGLGWWNPVDDES